MSNAIEDVQLGDGGSAVPCFTQLKPARDGGSIVLSLIGKVKGSPYHWMHKKAKGYRCNGEGCPACKAGVTQSWTAVALAAAYLRGGGIEIGYVPMSRPAFREVRALNGGKPRECNVKLTSVGGGYAFESDSGPARWTGDEAIRREVEAARDDPRIDALLESKLYDQLTDAEWERVLAGKSAKETEPEGWE